MVCRAIGPHLRGDDRLKSQPFCQGSTLLDPTSRLNRLCTGKQFSDSLCYARLIDV